jgi:LacI family transcriptional regulator
MVDGLLINYTQQIPPEMSEMIERNHVPAVWINSQRAKNCVYSDDYSAACTATEYLLQMGHRRIVYGTHPNSVHYSVVERQNGYADTMRKARLEPRILQAQRKYWISAEQWLLLAQRWTIQKHRPTAIMTYGDDAALAARYALQQAGLRVPQDVSIVTFSERIVDEAYWPMTTCRVPEYEIGRHSVEMLLERIQNPQVNLPARKLPFTFHPENSSAPPQATKTSATKKGKYP